MTSKTFNSQAKSSQKTSQADILIVDDTPVNLRLLSQILDEQGYQTRPVPDGQLALAAAQAKPPDLVLLDIRMPEMDGYEVCERLKDDAQTKDIPIIFISALDAVEDKVKAFTVGGVDYITKPFHVEEVLARVKTHLALRFLQEKLENANRKMAQELDLAGQVQNTFFPQELPDIPGWQISIRLQPARETSGDFFDVIPLPGGCFGILMADVVDKGVAAALYMALSWSLIRTYANDYPLEPEKVLTSVNQRILKDTNANQFVTVFYGVLDPGTGRLLFANAGHSPPLVINSNTGEVIRKLEFTGKPLGLFDDECCELGAIELVEDEFLIIYTDGITEAQNKQGSFFDENGLVRSVKKHLGLSVPELIVSVLMDVEKFTEEAPLADDIALGALVRD